MARILIVGVKVPFTYGGQDVLVRTLCAELKARGHEADIVELPFQPTPKENLITQVAAWRTLDVTTAGGQPVDLVIATKFPSYVVAHPKKSLWLVHQHRAVYELYATRYSDISDDPRDEQLRRMLYEVDQHAIGECAFVSGISKNVVERLRAFNSISGVALYPPLKNGGRYYTSDSKPYVLSVGRICSIKRVDLMLKALPIIHQQVTLKVVGEADEPGVMDYLQNEMAKHHLADRVEFMGRVSDDELYRLYAESMAVFYGPHNEDYGYVTLEAMASSKPIITCLDSGGTLEFINNGVEGCVVEPSSDAVGHAVNYLFENAEDAVRMGKAGRLRVEALGLLESGWDPVIDGLLSPLYQTQKGEFVDLSSDNSESFGA
jgi:glycosyltransferase involved in cell wall biosynthesis